MLTIEQHQVILHRAEFVDQFAAVGGLAALGVLRLQAEETLLALSMCRSALAILLNGLDLVLDTIAVKRRSKLTPIGVQS